MLDIRNAKVVPYDGNKKQVTVYPGFGDDKKWYIIPEPLFAEEIIDGETIPKFSLIEYTEQSGDVRATCTFSVRLNVTPEARDAAQAALPGVEFGKLDWIAADVYLSFSIGGEDYVFTGQPSLANENETTFILNLDSPELVEFFKKNFGPGAPALSSLAVSFDVTTLAKLQAVKATVAFNAERALEYEKTVDVKKNMWGSVTSRKETIRKNLKASESGSTTIDYNIPDPSDEFRQRVENWAFRTLEGMVDHAVEEAARLLSPGNADKMSARYMASFSREFTENQVIEWVISPQNILPAQAISSNWDRHHSKADFRRLVVNFAMLGSLTEAEVESVDLTVKYHDVTKSHTFTPDDQSDWTFEVDGRKKGNDFDPEYAFGYKVTLKNGQQFTVPDRSTSDQNISLSLADLGKIKVVFLGESLDFDTIEKVGIDFIFITPEGSPNIKKYDEITSENTQIVFSSDIAMHAKNFAYTYRPSYYMYVGAEDSGATKRYSVAAISNEGGKAKNTVLLNNPIQPVSYNIVPLNHEGDGTGIERVMLTATYDDSVNEFSDRKNIEFSVEDTPFFTFALKAVSNPNGANVLLNGLVVLDNQKTQPVRNVYLTGENSFLEIRPDKRNFTVKFDPALVDWSKVIRVGLDVFTLRDGAEPPANLEDVDEGVKDLTRTITFEALPKDAEGGDRFPTPAQYFNFLYDETKGADYFYSITYYHAGDQPDSYVHETEGDVTTVTLPKDGKDPSPKLIHAHLPPSASTRKAG